MSIEQFTEEQLLAELKRREQTKDRPRPLNNPDYSQLIKVTEAIFDSYQKDGYFKDDDHWCYESLMECLYGSNVFNWINKVNDG